MLQVLRDQLHVNASDGTGYRVYARLDLNLQHPAEQVISNQIAREGRLLQLSPRRSGQSPSPSGEVLAMAGGQSTRRPVARSICARANVCDRAATYPMVRR